MACGKSDSVESWLFFTWTKKTKELISSLCSTFVNIEFKQEKHNKKFNGNDYGKVASHKLISIRKEANRMFYSIRKTPLYHNAQLLAPDGQPLCVCDPKKALWYISNNLGLSVSEDPLVVKLNFEPAGRPSEEGSEGRFYLQERINRCVVCGKEDSYIRKNIIPHEYRKYFPEIMKSHQSHDVVLLCVHCHRKSNIIDGDFRLKLAIECSAPFAQNSNGKLFIDNNIKSVQNAGAALIKSRNIMPHDRILELEKKLKDFYGIEELASCHMLDAANMDPYIRNEEYICHGSKVVDDYSKVGLVKFEELWRRWFVESMSPKYMPENWSIMHSAVKLNYKMERLPKDHVLIPDYNIALHGTN